MALFGSDKNEEAEVKTIRPTVVRTQNVAKELLAFSKTNNVPIDLLDFNILDVQTYARVNEEKAETEWDTVDEHDLYELDEETAILNPNFQLKQTYEIEIFVIDSNAHNVCKGLKIAVGANATKCKVYLSIAAGSSLDFDPTLEAALKLLINKRKIRAGILINIFDEMLNDVVTRITAQTRIAEKLTYKQSETILIAESFEPTLTIDDALIIHYENDDKVGENEKVDYASRGFVKNVKENDLLIEYIKPKMGAAGRNCRGEFMEPKEPVIKNEVTFSIDDTIKEVDTDDSVQYIAKVNGYVVFESNTYSIKTDMDVGEISFKTTGSILSGVDSDVSISVKETNAEKDAIGSGMNVEVTEIDIDGNVGSNAHVLAKKATIGGQTHSSSVVKADKLDINVHKGKAYGKSIKITRLEHGEVDGDTVKVTQAMGGTIRAKEVEIEICNSHVTVTASKRIEIQRLQGSENIFIIDPLLKRAAQENSNDTQEVIKELEADINVLNKEVEKYEKLIKGGTASFLDIKKRLVTYKKNGVKMPESFVLKYKQFMQMQEHLKELQSESAAKKDLLSLQTKKNVALQDNILDARIINRDHWIGYNEIKFRLIDPPIELVYKPEQGSHNKVFGLVELESGGYEIEVMPE